MASGKLVWQSAKALFLSFGRRNEGCKMLKREQASIFFRIYLENVGKFTNFVASKKNRIRLMNKKTTERRKLISTVTRHLAKYGRIESREPRKGIILTRAQSPDARYGITSEELEKLLAEAREVGDAKYERLQRLRKHSTTQKVYIVPATIEKLAKSAGKL